MTAVANVLPRYQVVENPDAVVNMKVFRYVPELDEEGKPVRDEHGRIRKIRTEKIENIADGQKVYDVYFPQGHHIQVVGEKSLKDLNLDGDPVMVDMNTGEEVPEGFNDLKALVASKTRSRRLPK
jgi:hypothetical protein